MRFGIISDIHANALALDACLQALGSLGVDRLVFLGDIVGYGPDPEEVTQRVAGLVSQGAVCLLGNHDAAATGAETRMNGIAAAAIAWTRPRLSDTSMKFLEQLPLTVTEGDIIFVHAEASRPESWLYVTDASAALRSLLAVPQRLTICGHVHRPQLYCLTATAKVIAHRPVTGTAIPLSAQRQWLAVAGSAGQPRDGNPAASFLTYGVEDRHLTYHRAAYDHEAAALRVRAAGLPDQLAMRLLNGT